MELPMTTDESIDLLKELNANEASLAVWQKIADEDEKFTTSLEAEGLWDTPCIATAAAINGLQRNIETLKQKLASLND